MRAFHKKNMRIISILTVCVMAFGLCGCRLIYRDTEKEVVSVTYETVPVAPGEATGGETVPGESTDHTDPQGGNGSGSAETPEGNKTGTGTGTEGKKAEEKKLSGKLEVQIFTNESQTSNEGWTKVINAFEKATGVQVTAVIGSQVNTQMSTRWMNNNPPDFVWIDGAGIPDAVYRDSGKFANITSILTDGNVYGTDTKISSVIDQGTLVRYDGTYYYAPIMMATHGVWYDAAYLKTLGISVPTNYDEFVEASQKAVAAGTAAFTYPGQYTNYCFGGLIMPAIAAYGQSYLDSVLNGEASAFTDSRMTSILTRYRDYCTTSGNVLSGTTTMDHTTSQVRWLSHKALFITNGLWLADEVRKSTPAAFDMDYVTSPLIEKGQNQTAVFYAKSAAIASNAKNKENAEAFLRFLYTEEAQKALMSSFGYMSARKDIPYTAASGSMTPAAARALQYVNSGNVTVIYMHDNWGDVGEVFYNQINALTDGRITVQKAQEAMKKACEEYKR